MEIKKIISQTFSSNTFVVGENDNLIIIDAGCEPDLILDVVKGKRVKAIFLTHLHFDHIYFLSDYVEMFKCNVYLFNEKNITNKQYTLEDMVGKIKLPKNCYVGLKDDEIIHFENLAMHCIHTPGHSADSMCFKIGETLFAGDTLFYFSVGRTDLPTSSSINMLSSLQKLKSINFDVCCSGHGQNSTWQEQQDNINYFLMEL